MRRTTALAVVFTMILALSMPVFGGDMPGPGAVQKPEGNSAISEPQGGQAGAQLGADSSEATPNLIDQAMIFAVGLLVSLT